MQEVAEIEQCETKRRAKQTAKRTATAIPITQNPFGRVIVRSGYRLLIAGT